MNNGSANFATAIPPVQNGAFYKTLLGALMENSDRVHRLTNLLGEVASPVLRAPEVDQASKSVHAVPPSHGVDLHDDISEVLRHQTVTIDALEETIQRIRL